MRDFSWIWKEGEVWAVLGSNTSGKEALAYALVGQAVVRPREPDGSWVNTLGKDHKKGVVLSFEEGEKAIRYSLRFDESDFVEGGQHPGLTVARFLGIGSPLGSQGQGGEKGYGFDLSLLWDVLGLEAVCNRGLKYLSTGELRKVLIFKALREAPPLIVCEDLWEGLDGQSRQEATRFFQALTEGRRGILDRVVKSQENRPEGGTVDPFLNRSPLPAVLFLCDREDQILPSVTHVLRLKDGKVEGVERMREDTNPGNGWYYPNLSPVVPHVAGHSAGTQAVRILGEEEASPDPYTGHPALNSPEGSPLIRMRNIHVAYADHLVFEGFDFELYPGEHCFIQGPNGCGKSTLVKLITGDHPQGWGNDITVAGIPRKIGERLQDVRMQTSLVSHELHRSFLALEEVSALEVVLSGFFGTVGLYEPVGEEKMAEAAEALQICGLSGNGNRLFKDLPWGIQRLVLAARAFVRRPPLMILDEPCTGLDEEHRRILLATLERIAEEARPNGKPTILLVTHDPAERLSCMRIHLRFYQDGRTENGQPRYRWEFRRRD